jgi:beta-mannanase
VLQWYQDWAHGGFYAPYFDAIVNRGATPLLTWEPNDYTLGNGPQPEYALATIVAGNHDSYIRQFARDAAAWHQTFFLRFAHEMNGDWTPWCVGVSGNTSEQYVAAWRHIVDIFRQEGATNVRWVWTPNVTFYGAQPFAPMYPGDKYVDYVGLDGYNYGTIASWARWTDFSTVFSDSYDALMRLTTEPVIIAEVASVEVGGDKAAWINQAFLHDIPARFPRVRAIIWYNSADYMNADWRINSSESALSAFREVATAALYQGRLPA